MSALSNAQRKVVRSNKRNSGFYGWRRTLNFLQVTPLKLDGTCLITPHRIVDNRGYFATCWNEAIAAQHDLSTRWVQENESYNKLRGTLRGLHFQFPPHAQAKLVQVVRGAVLDVFVDLRAASNTYGQWDSIELSDENSPMVYLPAGFAHGYCTLSDDSLVRYKVDQYYAPGFEGGLKWDDPTVGINWPTTNPLVSKRDAALPWFDKLVSPF